MGFFDKLKSGLAKTRDNFVGGIEKAVYGKTEIDAALLDDLEEVLISADLGAETAGVIVKNVKEKLQREGLTNAFAPLVKKEIKERVRDILRGDAGTFRGGEKTLSVYLFVGVNGTGKTTTIGKLSAKFKSEGKKVILAAADTFR
ncbi:MAG: signal recognition particle receptor subunit alpha, partial [Nitrospirota bacterium]